jgi:hypothetical protein
MPAWEPWQILVGACLAAIAVMAVMLRLIMRSLRQVLMRRIADSFPEGETILLQDLSANFFGRESAGGMQLRGNGALVLNSKSLDFLMLWPNRRLQIPISAITGTSTVRSHCGKTIGRDLLKVQYITDAGEDSMAWYVPDVRGWQNQLDTIRMAAGDHLPTMNSAGGGN